MVRVKSEERRVKNVGYNLFDPSPCGTSPKTGEELGCSSLRNGLHEVQSYPKLSPCFRGTSEAEGVKSNSAEQAHRPKKRGEWWRSSKMRWAGLLCFLLLLFTACEHRELVDVSNMHYVRIYLDEHIRNVHYGFYDDTKPRPEYKTPRVLRVTLCDPQTGAVRAERYISGHGSDERGNYIDGHIAAAPGQYNLLAYNFDTQSTHVRNERDFYGMQVYTNPISDDLMSRLVSVRADDGLTEEDWNILYEPDHFFVESLGEVQVGESYGGDTLYNKEGQHFQARSVVQTFYIQVNVKGIEYVKSAVSLLTGMAGATQMHDRTMVEQPSASVYFSMNPGTRKARTGETVAVAYANFNTFGKLKNVEGYIAVTFEFNTIFGTTQTETIRLTDMFETPQVQEQQWIIIDKTIEIIPPEGATTGGLTPGVGEWENIEGNITI